MSRNQVLYFKGSNEDFGKYLDVLRNYLELNPTVTIGELLTK